MVTPGALAQPRPVREPNTGSNQSARWQVGHSIQVWTSVRTCSSSWLHPRRIRALRTWLLRLAAEPWPAPTRYSKRCGAL